MIFRIYVACLVMSLTAGACQACLRPTMDERAVQWSTAIVQAKLVSIGQRTMLGQLAERQGARGALGQVNTTFSYREYDFEVTDAIDGPLKKGQKFPVVRLFSVTDASLVVCSQHLSPIGIGREFLLLLRPLADFELEWPNRVKKPDIKGAMMIVHLELAESVKKEAMADLGAKIVEARAGESDASPKNIQRQIKLVQKAADDAKAEPAVRTLIQMGLKVIPAVQAAEEKTTGPAQERFRKIVDELTPPDPVVRVTKSNDPTAKQSDGE